MINNLPASAGAERLADRPATPSRRSTRATQWPSATLCGWCRSAPARRKYCSRKCRQAAWRLRKLHVVEVLNDEPKRFAYADPPYPGTAAKYYKNETSFAGEVDHGSLIRSLLQADYDGWALSTSAKALRDILPLCPAYARVCAWIKPIGASPLTRGIHNTWEPLIVVPGRHERPGKRDWLSAQPARHGGELPGRKPIAFAAWMFGLLGMRSGDVLEDLFPGTGIIGRAWHEISQAALSDKASAAPRGTPSPCI